MRAKRAVVSGAAGLLLAAGGLLAVEAAPAAADTPPETGCPASNELMAVATLAERGYLGMDAVDVNGDGLICVKPLNPVVQEMICEQNFGGTCPVPVIYGWRDNDLTPAH